MSDKHQRLAGLNRGPVICTKGRGKYGGQSQQLRPHLEREREKKSCRCEQLMRKLNQNQEKIKQGGMLLNFFVMYNIVLVQYF